MIERRNIIELIGNDQRKYHSCILTSYSLDFAFFEERILPALNRNGIKNVNLIVDGYQLEKAQEFTTGKELINKSYNFQAIYQKNGVFHPKIMLLIGKKHGLLLIGSGNISSSGLSSNDEIWSAFQLDNISNENSQIFAFVWDYLQPYINDALGFVKMKYKWIINHSPWLEELKIEENKINLKSINTTLNFISNKSNTSLYNQLLTFVPNNDIEEITIISPFYDKQGLFITNLYNDYKPKKINVIIDLKSETLPYDLDTETKKHISFYNWQECIKNNKNEDYYKLHAKLIHFKYRDKEIMYLGSANATISAFGDKKNKSVNAETGIIISRKSSNNWLNELGILLPLKSINLPDKKISNQILSEYDDSVKTNSKILYSELNGNTITIYLQKKIKANSVVYLLNREDLIVEKLTVTESLSVIKKDINNIKDIFRIYIADDQDNRISNYSFIHRAENLIKGNPDPKQEKINHLLANDYPEADELTELLKYIEFNWIDNNNKDTSNIIRKSANQNINSTNDNSEKKYEKLSEKDFNTISDEVLLKQSGLISTPTERIADFIRLYSNNFKIQSVDVKESMEQKIIEDDIQSGDGDEVNKTRISNKVKTYQTTLFKYLKTLNTQYETKLKEFYKEKRVNYHFEHLINLNALSNLLIAIYLIQLYQGKKITSLNSNGDIQNDMFIKEGTVFSGYNSIKGFLVNVLGKFLILSIAGYNKYEYDFINKRLYRDRKDLFYKSLFSILNLHWNNKEIIYRNILLLNLTHFLYPNSINISKKEIEITINDIKQKAVYIHKDFDDNFKYFIDNFIFDYKNWLELYTSDKLKEKLIIKISDIKEYSIIFNKRIGFNYIDRKRIIEDKQSIIDLVRDGYPIEDEKMILKSFKYGSKSIIYNK